MSEIQRIRSRDIWDAPNSAGLLQEYAQECATAGLGELNLQLDLYARMEEMGSLQCFGLYEGPQLAGFASVLTAIIPQYGIKGATVDSLFVMKSCREGGPGTALMVAIEQYARDSQCQAIFYSPPLSSQLERILANKHSYRTTGTVFMRRL